MVRRDEAAFLFAVLELREFRHEQEAKVPFFPKFPHIRDVEPELAEHVSRDVQLICAKQDEIAGLRPGFPQDGLHIRIGKILREHAVHFTVFAHGDPRHAARAVADGLFGERFDFPPRHGRATGNAHGAHDPAAADAVAEQLEGAIAQRRGQIHDGQAEAKVRLIAAVCIHGLGPGHAWKVAAELAAHNAAENALEKVFEMPEDILLFDEGHFHIHLRELRLAVRAQVLVAKAACDLVVFVGAAHHQKLLEYLRALRQRVEFALVDAAGHEIIARALGRGFGQHRRFHIKEARLIEIMLCGLLHEVAEAQVFLHLRPPQVEVAVCQPQFLTRGRRVERKGGLRRAGKQRHFSRAKLNFAGRDLRVSCLFIAQAHFALNGDDRLIAELFRERKARLVDEPAVEYDLQRAGLIDEVDEQHSAHISFNADPPACACPTAKIFPAEESAAFVPVHTQSSASKKYKKISPSPLARMNLRVRGEKLALRTVPPCLTEGTSAVSSARSCLIRCNARPAVESTRFRFLSTARGCFSLPDSLRRACTLRGSLNQLIRATRPVSANMKLGVLYHPMRGLSIIVPVQLYA